MLRKNEKFVARMLTRILMMLILFYQKAMTPWLGNRCRFYPSCSEYALEALKELSLFQALGRIFWRLLRCGPWARGGVDLIQGKNVEKKERL